MPLPKRKPDRKYSYADYLAWPEGERWELVDGEAYDMSPAPGTEHQAIIGSIYRLLSDFLEGKKCRVFVSPLDVRLSEKPGDSDETIVTVVQPDLLVVCDPAKIDRRGINGAPDLTVEVLSEATAYRDQTQKLALYEKHGVREYWIVNPGARHINLFRLEEAGTFARPEYYRIGDTIESEVMQGFRVSCDDIFKDDLFDEHP